MVLCEHGGTSQRTLVCSVYVLACGLRMPGSNADVLAQVPVHATHSWQLLPAPLLLVGQAHLYGSDSRPAKHHTV